MESFGNGVLTFGVLEDMAVVAVDDVDVLVEDEITLEAVALVGV